jgi:AcrR family transcriptional regulator
VSDTIDSHDAILSAAKHLFMQQGFRGISMRQIAEAVGVTKAALYYHFQDKEDLFVAIVASYLEDLGKLIEDAAAEGQTSREQINAIVHRILLQPVEQRAILRLTSQELSNVSEETRARFLELYHGRFIGRITAILQRGMDTHELRRLDPGQSTWMLLGMMYPYFQVSPATGSSPTNEQIDMLVSIFFDGLAV